jgi:Fur-regulated basic protein B
MDIIIVTIGNKVGEKRMRKIRKRSFSELVNENKLQLLKDQTAIDRIEKRLENRHLSNAK